MKQFTVKKVQDKDQWEAYIQSQGEANFLQAYNWGLFHQKLDNQFYPLAIFDGEDEQVGAMMTVKKTAKRGDYLTVAGGPILDWHSSQTTQILKTAFAYLKKLARKENCWFVRIRPQVEQSQKVEQMVQNLGLVTAPMHLSADLTLELDLDQTEDEILMQMRKNTRYYIRRAKRDGVKIKKFTDSDKIQEFYDYQIYLAEKHDFVPFSYEFLLNQFETFAADNQVQLINSYSEEDQLLASAFIIFYNQEAVYHYGISTPKNRDLPGSYAVQWAAIKEAKQRDCQTYNFWGVAPKDEPEHRFAGVSMFKSGFGGQRIQYLPAHDLPVHPFYQFTRAFELIRKRIRGL